MSPFEFPGDDGDGGSSGTLAVPWTLVGTALDEGNYILSIELECTVTGTGTVTGSLRYTNADGVQEVDALELSLGSAASDSASLEVHLSAASDVEYSTTLAGTSGGETYTVLPLLRPATLPRYSGAAFEMFDGADNTKRVRFDASAVPAGTTVTLGMPDVSAPIVVEAASLAYVAKSGAYGLAATDCVLDGTAGSWTATLPTAAGVAGKLYIIKNSGAGTITLATTGGETIDGGAPGTVAAGAVTRLLSNGTNWITV